MAHPKKIFAVAMSGGVDSSVAAALCKQQGHEVIGFTMWHFDDNPPLRTGVHEKAVDDAKRVCQKLDIPHHVIDLRNEFNDIVISNFISEYLAGRTPNPCVLCNQTIKWGSFIDKISTIINAPFSFVTGHYAKILTNENGLKAIYKANDSKKDQTYMLWKLSQEQIQKTEFPLADCTKEQVRKIAHELALPVAEKKDSQDNCFITGKYTDIITYFVPDQVKKTGDVVFENSSLVIGKHKGLFRYTIGQRKGLPSWCKPIFVKSLVTSTNTVIVTDNANSLLAKYFIIKEANWHEMTIPKDFENITVQIRYNSSPKEIIEVSDCSLLRINLALKESIGNNPLVTLKNPARSVTPGQSAVFYRGKQLLGGAIIS